MFAYIPPSLLKPKDCCLSSLRSSSASNAPTSSLSSPPSQVKQTEESIGNITKQCLEFIGLFFTTTACDPKTINKNALDHFFTNVIEHISKSEDGKMFIAEHTLLGQKTWEYSEYLNVMSLIQDIWNSYQKNKGLILIMQQIIPNINISQNNQQLYQSVTKAIEQLHLAKEINFKNQNKLAELADKIKIIFNQTDLNQVTWLVLAQTELYLLPEELEKFTNLQMLALPHNYFTQISSQILSLKKLQLLHMWDNPIETLSQEAVEKLTFIADYRIPAHFKEIPHTKFNHSLTTQFYSISGDYLFKKKFGL